ncbi:MAG: tRNA (adenosine(37)-N6)-dimethylallyltransferase MiaA [Bacillota bacterium]|nr:tRNA (adenosine(37)-N6)-dimethylallyltransferase MiaA [Bacillota bacterium]
MTILDKQLVLVVVGPTAVGKTELSLSLAKDLNAEIISADSMQVYRGMDIGTAKAGIEEQQRVKHHMIDVIEPNQSFNVADYVSSAEKTLHHLKKRGVTPLITGGTGLYIDALLDGFLFPDSTADPELRARFQQQAEDKPHELYAKLQKVDPNSAKRIHSNDLRRIIRALEVYERTGEPISVLRMKKAKEERPYNPLYIGLTRDRSDLYSRINKRVDDMVARGLVDEVEQLLRHYPEQPTALQALGYKEIVEYIEGRLSLDEAKELLKRDTRRYAKRQLSWFRRNKRINWFNRTDEKDHKIKEAISVLWLSHH